MYAKRSDDISTECHILGISLRKNTQSADKQDCKLLGDIDGHEWRETYCACCGSLNTVKVQFSPN